MSFSNSNLPKMGIKVTGTRRNGQRVTGKVMSVQVEANGPFVSVNVAPPRAAAQMIKFRPSQLARA